MKKFFFVPFFLLLVILAINFSVVMAEEESQNGGEVIASDLGVAEPNILPDSKLYFLKEWGRGFSLFFTFNSVKKVEKRFQYANEKLIETKRLAEKTGNEEITMKAMEKYQNIIDDVANKIEELKNNAEDNLRLQGFIDKFIEDGLKHQQLLSALKNKFENAPESARESIESVRENGIEKMGGVLNSVDGDNVDERLTRIMEKVEDNSVKKLENIEVLKRVQLKLQDKLPEGAKAIDVIGNVIERQTERVESRVRNVYNISNGSCTNLCGNNACEEIVCLAIGCPCPETPKTCPQDCSNAVCGDGVCEEGEDDWCPACVNFTPPCLAPCIAGSCPSDCSDTTEKINGESAINVENIIQTPRVTEPLVPAGCVKKDGRISHNPLSGATNQKCCANLTERKISRWYGVCVEI